MSMSASKALAWAASQIGYSRWDDPEEGSLYGRWYAKKHGTYYGTTGVPFCAMFASWCLTDDDGASVIPGGDFAYVPYGINAAARAGQLVSPMTQAAPGDLRSRHLSRPTACLSPSRRYTGRAQLAGTLSRRSSSASTR